MNTPASSRWQLHALGTGAAQAADLGNAAAVLERDDTPLLLMDCGPDVPARFRAAYGRLPAALYLTHLHMDHVGGLETLFYELYFARAAQPCRLYAHAALVPLLQARLADFPRLIAEGGVQFWDVFQLIPCTRGFWLDALWFEVFAVRHHRAQSAFGLALPGSFVWTGDTRPIPEALAVHAARNERVFHDCGLHANPSHTGLEDLPREYSAALRARLMLYHQASAADADALRDAGYAVLAPGERVALTPPLPVDELAG